MKQGEIWLVNMNATIAESDHKVPVVIINDNALRKLPLKIIAPLMDWKEHFSLAPWMISVNPSNQNGLTKRAAIDCFQIRSVSETLLTKRIGTIAFSDFLQIQEGILKVIGYM